MSKAEKAKIILAELNKEYSIPSYMEEDVLKGIVAGLTRVEKKENRT